MTQLRPLVLAVLVAAMVAGGAWAFPAHPLLERHKLTAADARAAAARRDLSEMAAGAVGRVFGAKQGFTTPFPDFTLPSTTTLPPSTPPPPSPTPASCANAETSPEAQQINASCGSLNVDFSVVFNLQNDTEAANQEIARICSTGCRNALEQAVAAFSECFPVEFRLTLRLLDTMCAVEDGQFCAVRLRAVESLTACSTGSRPACEAAPQCTWREGECHSTPNAVALRRVCGPCYRRYLIVIGEYLLALAGGNVTREEAATLRLAQRLIVNQQNFFCARVGDTFCLPVLNSVPEEVYALVPNNTLTIAEIRGNLSQVCSPTGKRCLTKVVAAELAIVLDVTQLIYDVCIGSLPPPESEFRERQERACVDLYQRSFVEVNSRLASVQETCSVNTNSENCYVHAHEFVRDPCWTAVTGESKTCNATCAAWLGNASQSIGCCWDRFQRHFVNTAFPRTELLPPRVAARFPPRPSAPLPFQNRSAGFPLYDVCNRTADNGFQAAATRAAMLLDCPTATPVNKELGLPIVRWNQLANNESLRSRLAAALRRDLARALGVPEGAIVNGTLREDSSVQLTTASRRQTSSSSATKFAFGVQADSQTESQEVADAFDTAVSQGEIDVTTTADIIAQECPDCVGSPTAAPGETAAPPPTGNLFAALVGREATSSPSPGSPGTPSPSSAASLALVAATIVAAALAMLL